MGNTPLMKFETLSKEIGRNIYFKAEFLNPGHSIKDRAACYLLDSAIKSGKLSPGGTLSEATAGNTGIALALLARSYDPPFKVRLFVPDVLIQDKIDLLESVGCTVVKCPSDVTVNDPLFFNNQAMQYAEDHENTVFVNQMGNTENRRAHYENTGPEIWSQLNGKVDGFTASAGTGGTLIGVSSYLKEKSGGKCQCWAADRFGSGLCSYVKSQGKSWESEGSSFVEGIGKKSLTGQMDDTLELLDGAVTITDTECVVTCYRLFHEQGIWIGPSAALNICAARDLAKTLPEGSNVVTTAADYADNYASKLFNKRWLQENGHWDSIPEEMRKYAT